MITRERVDVAACVPSAATARSGLPLTMAGEITSRAAMYFACVAALGFGGMPLRASASARGFCGVADTAGVFDVAVGGALFFKAVLSLSPPHAVSVAAAVIARAVKAVAARRFTVALPWPLDVIASSCARERLAARGEGWGGRLAIPGTAEAAPILDDSSAMA
ncbi:hypothetical protein AB0H73_19935 [Streptomyces olivoreticuli]